MTSIVAILLVLLVPSLAWADPGSSAVTLSTGASIALLSCMLISYGLRRLAPLGGFLHTEFGALVLAAASATVSAVASVVQTQGLDKQAIVHGALGALMSLFATSNPSAGAVKAASSSLRLILPLLLAPLLVLQGCAKCNLPENAKAPVCVLQSNLISCGEQDAFALVPVVLGIVGGLIAGQPFDASNLVSQLEQQGIKDVPCVVAAVEAYFMAPNPLAAAKMHEALKVALARKGMHGLVSVKLHGGASISAVLP